VQFGFPDLQAGVPGEHRAFIDETGGGGGDQQTDHLATIKAQAKKELFA
jgi:hypothetical protein